MRRNLLHEDLVQNSETRTIKKCIISSNNKGNFYHLKNEFIRGKKWYPFLVRKGNRKPYLCLLDDLGYNSTNIYVRLTTNGHYKFSNFYNAIELKEYINQFHSSLRCFDEITMEGPQKPRFDIDLEDEKYSNYDLDKIIQMLINQVIDGILFYLENISLEKNIKLFTSHDETKRSVHIVIDGVFHDSYLDAKGFYDNVIQHVNPDFRKYVDHGIYSKKGQLRIMNCCKWNSGRIKTLQNSFIYYERTISCEWGELDNEMTRFISSLISVISGCERLKPFAKKIVYSKVKDLSDDVTNNAIEITKNLLGKNYTFTLERVTGTIIILHREKPSFCIICNVIHDKQHPFLYILGNNVYFNCRRHPENKSQFIGNISINSVKVEIKSEPLTLINKVTSEGKTILVSDGSSFNFRRKNCPKIETNLKITREIIQEISPEISPETITEIFLSSNQDITNRLNSIDKRRVTKKRPPKSHSDIPLSSLIDFDKIEW